MQVLEASVIGRVVLGLYFCIFGWYENSAVATLVRGGSAIFRGVWANSLIGRMFSVPSGVSRAWSHSLFCRALTVLLNLPILLLRRLYLSLRRVFDGSAAAQIGFGIVADTPVAIGWLMLVILMIPYKQWNNAYSLIGFALMLCFTLLAGIRNKQVRLDIKAPGPYAVLFASLVILAVPMSAYVGASARFLLYHISCMLCVLVLVSTVRAAAQLRRLAAMASLGLLIISLYGIVQAVQGVEVNASYVDLTLNEGMPGRIYSMFENPNAFGEVLVLLIPIALGLMLASKGWCGRFLGLAAAGAGTLALLLTYSRAGWLGLAAAVLLFVFLWKRKILPLFLVAAVLAIPFLPSTILNRILTIFNFEDTSTSSRFPLYEAAGRLLAERPLQGAGLGSEAVRSAVRDLNLYHGKSPFVHAHNVYLQAWAEMGIFGLLTLLGSIGWALKRGGSLALRKIGSSSARMMIIGSLSALLGIMVCGLADYIWHYPRVMLIFWFVFGMAAASIRLAMAEHRRAEQRRAKA